ncbi:DUF3667 domain-containing protein [Alteromonadaceae bacterium M269]|nr:DUF3667 domain-containing protein [Alteromonadaceae bacterium M269]
MVERNTNMDMEQNLEDVTGFNLRSLRTIRDLFIRPREVFETYQEGTLGRYAPSFKIWISLVGLTFLVLFLLGGADSFYAQYSGDSFRGLLEAADIPEDKFDDFMNVWAEILSIAQMPIVSVFMLLTVPLLKRFNRELSVAARVNIAFAILIPSLVIGFGTLILAKFYHLSMLASMSVTWLTYFVTFFRGTLGWFNNTFPQAFFKSLLYTLALIVIEFVAYLVVIFVTSMITLQQF